MIMLATVSRIEVHAEPSPEETLVLYLSLKDWALVLRPVPKVKHLHPKSLFFYYNPKRRTPRSPNPNLLDRNKPVKVSVNDRSNVSRKEKAEQNPTGTAATRRNPGAISQEIDRGWNQE